MLPNLHFKYKFRLSRKAINETFIDTQRRLYYRIFEKDTKKLGMCKGMFLWLQAFKDKKALNLRYHVAKELYTQTRMTNIKCSQVI